MGNKVSRFFVDLQYKLGQAVFAGARCERGARALGQFSLGRRWLYVYTNVRSPRRWDRHEHGGASRLADDLKR